MTVETLHNVRTHSPSRYPLPLPTIPNTVSRTGDVAALWLGPDEWLVVNGSPDRPEGTGLVDVSDQFTTIVLSGPATLDLLAHGCALDLSRIPVDGCAQTQLARANVTLWRTAPTEFTVLVRSSFAHYLQAWLTDAAVEL